ncbi:MAG TPA: rod shape-determining protein [Chthoniobacteraceae bacterium]|jgi:rod shape-determining protein MreB|nr:rod shape-determining protein [Chthoniobacteraceae bacterium]
MTGVFGSPDLAIDLGTATTRVAGGLDGICLRPSTSRNIRALNRGVIVDVHAATEVLRPLLQKRRRATMARQRVLACAPSDVTPMERNSVRTCILEAGASSVIVVPEPLAAAVGSGIDIGCKYAKFLVDFGDGVTDCAVIRDGQIVASLAERVGCGDLRRIVQAHVEASAGIVISEQEAERLLRKVGLTRKGRELCRGIADGRSVEAMFSVEPLHARLRPVLGRMLAPIKALLRDIPASIGAEVIEDGIFLTGGGALLPGMRDAVAADSAIDTRIVGDPLGAVIRGAWTMLPFAASLNLWKAWGRHPRTCSATVTRAL